MDTVGVSQGTSKTSTVEREDKAEADATLVMNQSAAKASSPEMESTVGGLKELCSTAFPQVSSEVDRLLKVKDPETEPYKSKYEAIRLLKNLKLQMTNVLLMLEEGGLTKPEACDSPDKVECKESEGQAVAVDAVSPVAALRPPIIEDAKDVVALLTYKQGVAAFEADDSILAKDSLLEALPRLEAARMRHAEPLLDVFNTLGTIHCHWGEHKTAEMYLFKAKEVYESVMSSGNGSQQHDESVGVPLSDTVRAEEDLAGAPLPTNTEQSGSVASDQSGSGRLGKLQSLYTTTTFCLAQVYVFLQEEDRSAVYCAETLSRQLKYRDTFQPVEWAQNCTQLSGFYVSKTEFVKAMRCLGAASAVMELREDKDEGKDVEANIAIGRGKLHMNCLRASRDRKFEQEEQAALAADPSSDAALSPVQDSAQRSEDKADTTTQKGEAEQGEGVKGEGGKPRDASAIEAAEFDFSSLRIEDDGLGDGADKDGCVHDYPAAVVQFNKALSMFKKAMEYYELNGFVNDHFNILMDISSLHKYLAFFEPQANRKKAIHARRASRLEPLVTQLNPNAYPVIWKQLNYELGCIAREVMDLESEGKAQPAKVLKAAKAAAAHYERFLASATANAEDEEFRYELVMAHFGLARVYQTCHSCLPSGEQGLAHLEKSLAHYRSVLEYGKRFDLPMLTEQLQLCQEMVELIPAKLDLDHAKRGLPLNYSNKTGLAA